MTVDIEVTIKKREQVQAAIRKILIDNLGVRREPDEIDPDTPLFGSGLGLDSVDNVELIVSIDVAFGVRLTNDPVGRAAFRTVNTLSDFVISQQENADVG
jgi:acyl carrier protein